MCARSICNSSGERFRASIHACLRAISLSTFVSLGDGTSSLPDSAVPAKRVPRLMPNEADLELVRQMNAAATTLLSPMFYDRFAPGLFSMIYAILRDQKESEDVLQEAFVQMWKRTRDLRRRRRSSLFTWAVMISRHKAIDRLRSRQRHSRLARGGRE